jgi:hypothetical protein
MGELLDDIAADEPLAADGNVDIDAERVDVEAAVAMALPDLGGRAERGIRACRDVEDVEREVAGDEL